jgi:hypothetical protein
MTAWGSAPGKPEMSWTALKARFTSTVRRAFSAGPLCNIESWGGAPGYVEIALSAPMKTNVLNAAMREN